MTQPTELAESAVRFDGRSFVDPCGRVFFYQDRVFRGILPGWAAETRALLASGLMERLVAEGLSPRVWVSEFTFPGFEMVLEHERLDPVVFPHEWPFSMLRDAALCVLAVNRIAATFGYETKDCHPNNVIFHGGRAKYVDLGSFVTRLAGSQAWRAREEFTRAYVYPLNIWANGDTYLARLVLSAHRSMPHESYWLYRVPLLRYLGRFQRDLGRWVTYAYRARLVSAFPEEFIRENTPPALRRAVEVALALRRRGWLPWQSTDLNRLARQIQRIDERRAPRDVAAMRPPPRSPPRRYARVAQIVRQLGAGSVIELGTDGGAVARELLASGSLTRAVCTDSDDERIDELYASQGQRPAVECLAVLDLMQPTTPVGLTPPSERLQCEAAVAMALIHRLLLIPPFFPPRLVLDAIASFSKRWVLLEFMPGGLHDGPDGPPTPRWYTIEGFREAVRERLDLIHEEVLEPGHVLFVAARRGTAPADVVIEPAAPETEPPPALASRTEGRSYLFKSSALSAGTLLSAVLATVYVVWTGRVVGPSTYGIVASALAASQISAIVVGPLESGVSRDAASLRGRNDQYGMAALFRTIRRWISWLALLGLFAAAFTAEPLARLLSLDSAASARWLVAFVIVSTSGFLMRAMMRGTDVFVPHAVSQVAESVARLAIGGALIASSPTAGSVLAGYVAGSLVGLLVAGRGLRGRFEHAPSATPAQVSRVYAAPMFFVHYFALVNLDVIVARACLGHDEAGQYGAASTMVRLLYLVVMPFIQVLLPEVANRRAQGTLTGALVGRAFFALGATAIGTFAVIAALAEPVIRMVYGPAFAGGAPVLILLWPTAGLNLLQTMSVNVLLAHYPDRYSWLFAIPVVFLCAALWHFHDSLVTIALCSLSASVVGTLVTLLVALLTSAAAGPRS